jgi:hypothetical protein
MSPTTAYRERVLECLTLAQSTHDPQTKVWAIEMAALLHRLSRKSGDASPQQQSHLH